jgi:radical SAM protein with 4Fe4S-binding SPASM domain
MRKVPLTGGWFKKKRKLYLLLDLNSGCNIHCIHCYRNALTPNNGSISREQLAILERDVFPYADKLSLAQTAETLMLPLLPAVLLAARRARVPFSCIQTNGTYLNADKAQMLLDLGLTSLGISFDSGTKETFERVRAGASWDQVMSNIRTFMRLRNAHPNRMAVSFNFALMKQNAHEALDFIRFAKEEGATSVTFAHLVIETEEMRDWSLSNDPKASNRLTAALRAEVHRLQIPARIPADIPEKLKPFEGRMVRDPEYRGYCNAAHENWLFMMANGDCFPCLNLQDSGYLGNAFETPFREIWYGYSNQMFRRRALSENIAMGCDQCKECTLSEELGDQRAFFAKRMTTLSAAELDARSAPAGQKKAAAV